MKIFACAVVVFVGACSSRGDASPPASAPIVVIDAAPSPPRPDAAPPGPPVELSHVIARGDTLDPIAQARYGSRHYSRLLEAADHVSSNKLRIGQSIALPSVEDLAAPIARKLPDAAAALLRAHATWTAVEPGLWDEHRKTRTYKAPDLARAIADVDAAHAAFAKAHAPAKELASLSASLRDVAGGRVDPEGYGLDDVDRRFADSLAALVTWAQR